MKAKTNQPPLLAQRFLKAYCRAELLEDLQGDLNEYFHRNLLSKGVKRARWIYWLDVIKFCKPYTIRKPKFINLLIQWIMISSYMKTSGRSIVRNKLFSGINIIGLAISMSVGLLMIAFLGDLFAYDEFHENVACVYRINSTIEEPERAPHELASTSVKAGRKIKEGFTGVEAVAILRSGFQSDVHYKESATSVSGFWATPSVFEVFTFPLISGDPKTALVEPYSIVLTASTAKKILGNESALGKTIKLDSTEYLVTGVMRDVPKFSHIQFESLVSFATVEIKEKENRNFLSWTNVWSNYVYVLLPETSSRETLDQNLVKLNADENALLQDSKVTTWTQPLKGIAISNDLGNPIGPMMFAPVIWVLGILTLIVIICACFNYTNLSIARSLRRSREVGIRKVIGAAKSHVIAQFVSESILISIMALLLAAILFLLLKPQFLSIAPELGELVSLDLSIKLIGWFLVFAIMVGVCSGILPAFFFSRINAVTVLKDVSSIKVFRKINMRKGLIFLQYSFSLIFIFTTLIAYRQYKHFLGFDLGFQTENVLNIRLVGNKPELLIKELSEIPEITALSKSQMITSVGTYWGGSMKYNNPRDSLSIFYNIVDENYFPLHGHKLLAGRNFKVQAGSEVIVNETTLNKLSIGNGEPLKALGEIVTMDGEKLEIIGVMKDFHYGKVEDEMYPVVFRYSSTQADFVNAKIQTTDVAATMAAIEKAWKKIDNIHPMQAKFYSEDIEHAYNEISAMIKIIGFLAFLAISIASLGLFGMVVFTTETRLKEISIRKVMGANEGNLVYLMSKGFLILLGLSALIALPVTYFFFDQVVLSDIAYRAPIGLGDLLGGVLAVMSIALLMIGSQTMKVARSNPAEVLKVE